MILLVKFGSSTEKARRARGSAALRARNVRSWLRRRVELFERSHPAWKILTEEEAANGHINHNGILIQTDHNTCTGTAEPRC